MWLREKSEKKINGAMMPTLQNILFCHIGSAKVEKMQYFYK
jgi:hypothetical protein